VIERVEKQTISISIFTGWMPLCRPGTQTVWQHL